MSGRERKRLKRKRIRMQERTENIRKDFHHKTANWLTRRYEAVVIGKLPKGIISRNRSLHPTVKRAYNALGHFQFRCCLRDKCQARGVVYLEVNESYTSKSCTLCGHINEKLGSSEIFRCCNPSCPSKGQSWDRDINGARNILLKSINESYLRITANKDSKTLALGSLLWTQNPQGCSLVLDILRDELDETLQPKTVKVTLRDINEC